MMYSLPRYLLASLMVQSKLHFVKGFADRVITRFVKSGGEKIINLLTILKCIKLYCSVVHEAHQ